MRRIIGKALAFALGLGVVLVAGAQVGGRGVGGIPQDLRIRSVTATGDLTLDAGNSIGDHIIFSDNTGDSTDFDFRGSLFNSAGDFDVFDTLTVANQVRTSAGTAGTPTHSFTSDTNSGLYRIGEDNIGITTGGTLRLNVSSSQAMFNDGTAAAPAWSWTTDNDGGMYRYANNEVGFAAGGAVRLRLAASVVDVIGQSLDDSTDDNVNVAASMTVVGNLAVTGSISGGVFGGCVDSAASAENVPTGWSASRPATGQFTVTHGLALASADDIAFTVTQRDQADAGHFFWTVLGVNSFDVFLRDIDNAAENEGFCFTGVQVAN
jgi:hypothetical protein